ncbi:TOMM precursor leader peptide-binding protein [Kitasatospora sp. NPDC002227]|uniref:TOMM precursor leader peptide-binding protein n=1 Tax=Kitasatospora sp. NPDC002227 TaxID=3154773 RepID=UPI00331A6535
MIDLHILAVGEFGQAVARRLVDHFPAQLSEERDLYDPSLWPRARARAVIAWRETPRLFELADGIAFATGVPWLAVTLGATALRVGPAVLGTRGPCYRCFLARQFQHGQLRDTDRQLFQAYDGDPRLGPGGHLESHVSLAEAMVSHSVRVLLGPEPEQERGRVRSFDLLSAGSTALSVVPVHGCTRCDTTVPDATWRRLSEDLRGLCESPAAESVPPITTRRG